MRATGNKHGGGGGGGRMQQNGQNGGTVDSGTGHDLIGERSLSFFDEGGAALWDVHYKFF